MMRLDVRRSDQKGLHAVIGAVTIFVLTKLWLSGDLATWFTLITGWFRGVESSGFSSATYAIVELVTSLVYGIGAIALLAWSGILWLVRDVSEAVRMWRDGRDEQSVVNVEEPAAGDEPGIYSDPIVDAIEILADSVKDLVARVEAMEAEPVAKATTRGRKPSA